MYRDTSTAQSRSIDLWHTIDPGMVNRRLVQTVVGPSGMEWIDKIVKGLPDLPQGLLEARIDHAYSQVLLEFCRALPAKTLAELLASETGTLFCSTERFEPCPEVYRNGRVESVIAPQGNTQYRVVIEYGIEHIRSDTLRLRLHEGDQLSVVAQVHRKVGETLYCRPLVIGFPWMSARDEE